MSDCSNNAWKLPKRADMEPGVLYMPSLDVDGVREIDAKGVRFERVRECELTHVSIPIPGDDEASIEIYETACGERVFSDYEFCPYCGGKLRGGGE